jgi:hypothetical protein
MLSKHFPYKAIVPALAHKFNAQAALVLDGLGIALA